MSSAYSSRRARLAIALALCLVGPVAIGQDKPLRTPLSDPAVDSDARALAAQLTSRWAPVAQAAGQDLALWQEQFSTQLSLLPLEQLRALDRVAPAPDGSDKARYAAFIAAFRGALMATVVEPSTGTMRAKLGSSLTDQVFIPIAPCRIVDTRNVGGPIAAGAARNFNFYASSGSFDWSVQGGIAGSASTACPGTINPNGVAPSAAMATITVVGPSATGNFVAWGGTSPLPTTSALNWRNPGDIAANTTVLPAGGRSGTGPGGPVADFAMYYNGPSGAAQVVVDVVGYFVQNQATPLSCVVVTNSTSVAAHSYGYSTATCGTGYQAAAAGCQPQAFNGLQMHYWGPASASSTNSYECGFFNPNASPVTFYVIVNCCIVP